MMRWNSPLVEVRRACDRDAVGAVGAAHVAVVGDAVDVRVYVHWGVLEAGLAHERGAAEAGLGPQHVAARGGRGHTAVREGTTVLTRVVRDVVVGAARGSRTVELRTARRPALYCGRVRDALHRQQHVAQQLVESAVVVRRGLQQTVPRGADARVHGGGVHAADHRPRRPHPRATTTLCLLRPHRRVQRAVQWTVRVTNFTV